MSDSISKCDATHVAANAGSETLSGLGPLCLSPIARRPLHSTLGPRYGLETDKYLLSVDPAQIPGG
jgi:hypothetical protein